MNQHMPGCPEGMQVNRLFIPQQTWPSQDPPEYLIAELEPIPPGESFEKLLDRAVAARGTPTDTKAWASKLAEDSLKAGEAEYGKPGEITDTERLAQMFHESYERLAPDLGYKTRKASAKPWSEVPENNRKLMIAVCAEIYAAMRRKHTKGDAI